jgi:hypothetical protein
MTTLITLKSAKKGEYIKRTADAKRVYIKGAYCRNFKGYECTAADDCSASIFIRADKLVFIGFTY